MSRASSAAAKLGAFAVAEALRQCGEREAKSFLHHTPERQRGRVVEVPERQRLESMQIAMDLGDGEEGRRQLEANARRWERRLAQLDADLERESERIHRFCDIQRARVEPPGLIDL